MHAFLFRQWKALAYCLGKMDSWLHYEKPTVAWSTRKDFNIGYLTKSPSHPPCISPLLSRLKHVTWKMWHLRHLSNQLEHLVFIICCSSASNSFVLYVPDRCALYVWILSNPPVDYDFKVKLKAWEKTATLPLSSFGVTLLLYVLY